jgi:chemotaxis signal transduction protein
MNDISHAIPANPNESAVQDLAAWILPISPTQSVAVGRYELKYIEYVDTIVTLPGLPAFCEQGFIWRNRFIPALDLWSLLTRRRIPATSTEHLAAIIAYENTHGELAVGAILLAGVPKLLGVAATQSVALTDLHQEWQLLAQAAFRDENTIYPVLDLRGLFDKTPVDLLSLH